MHRATNQQISLVEAAVLINVLFDQLENKDKLLVDENSGGFMGCA